MCNIDLWSPIDTSSLESHTPHVHCFNHYPNPEPRTYLARGGAVEAEVVGGDGDGGVRPREEEGRGAPKSLVAEHLNYVCV